MKTKIVAIVSTVSITLAANAAITVQSSSFNGVTDGAIDTTGALDWGYISNDGNFFDGVYDAADYGSLSVSTVSGSYSTGAVTLTENDGVNDAISAQTNDSNFTFDGNAAYGSYGGYAPGEQDVWTMEFTDLAAGQYSITLYLGHSSTNRSFDMDVSGTDYALDTTTTGGTIAGLGSTVAAYGSSGAAFTYDIEFTTTSTSDVLTLVHGDTGGGSFGGAIFAGYTITPIPEPSSTALIGLAGLMMFIRKRR